MGEGVMNDGILRKILLVEDNPDHAELLSISIKKTLDSIQLIQVKDGEEALIKMGFTECSNEISSVLPDLVLLDVNLPGINGKDVLRKIRSNKKFDKMPVCILTTSTSIDEIELMLNLGANAYIPKTEVEPTIGMRLKEFLN